MKHFDRAIKNNCIGILNYWKFKDSFLFLNWEKGKIEKVKKPSDVKSMSKKDAQINMAQRTCSGLNAT